MRHISQARTALFVPGDRPERFDKALNSGADSVIIDWEDAVEDERKEFARNATAEWFSSRDLQPGIVAIRVNSTDSAEHEFDQEAIKRLITGGHSETAIVQAKTESSDDAQWIHRLKSSIPIIALIESARGLTELHAIASSGSVHRLAFGAIDFALDCGLQSDPDVLAHARSSIAVHSRSAGLPGPLDSPEVAFRDDEAVQRGTNEARRFGFTGKLCIHPAQISWVHDALRPSEQDVLWAKSIIGPAKGAVQVDGKMVDKPLYERARRILNQAAEASE